LKWCFDTSALIEPWVRRYPPDLFPQVWERIAQLCDAGAIVAPADVLLEIEKQKDDLHDWVKKLAPTAFLAPDRPVMEAFTEIVNAHPGFMKINSTKSGADPFVVALALVKGLTVVTYETPAKADAAPKMPNVCSSRGVQCGNLVDVLRAEGLN
jgi:hypothetical protein